MKKYHLFIVMLLLNMYLNISATTKSACVVPGINSEIPFPFGQKSDEFKLECVKNGSSKFEIISLRLPIDRDGIERLEFSPIELNVNAGLSAIAPELKEKTLQFIPKLLFFKRTLNSIIGIELCLPKAEQAILKIERIALFFIQNIAEKNLDQGGNLIGFNKLSIYNTGNTDHKMVIIGETSEQKNEIEELVKKLLNTLALEKKMPRIVANMIKNGVMSLGKNTIALVVERTNRVANVLNEYNSLQSIGYALLSGQDYLIYNETNEAARNLIPLIQKMPLNTNYYLCGKVMEYSEEAILFKYQLEGYLRSINSINVDGTTLWPYNIPKWKNEKINTQKFEAWIKNKWNVYFSYFYPAERKQYENDKKTAQKYLNILPLTKKEALAALKKTPNKKSTITNKAQYLGLISKIKKELNVPKHFAYNTFKQKELPFVAITQDVSISSNKEKNSPYKKRRLMLKSFKKPENWDNYTEEIKDLSIIKWLSNAYVEELIDNKIQDLNNLGLEFESKLFIQEMKNNATKFITAPIMKAIKFLQETKILYKQRPLGKMNMRKLVSEITDNLSYTKAEKNNLLKKLEKEESDLNELLDTYFKESTFNARQELLELLLTIIIKFGYGRIKALSNLLPEQIAIAPELEDDFSKLIKEEV